MQGSSTANDFSIDTDETRFTREVLEESQRRPVVVDFWAPWCGPCKTLGPALEKLAAEGGGKWRLAKVNVDENERLATLFRVQSVPAVKAFHRGEIVDEFVGALPEHQLRAWLEGFVPGEAEELVALAKEHVDAGRTDEGQAAWQQVLALKPRQGDALLGLARIEAAAGQSDAAERHLDQMLPADAKRLSSEAAQLRLELHAAAGAGGGIEEARERAARDPADLEAQVAYGRALGVAGRHEEALQLFLDTVKKSPRVGAGDEARKAMLEIFDVVGARSELADRYRSLLAAELYR